MESNNIFEEIKDSLPIRQEVLGYSLLIEAATSTFLSALVGAKSFEKSKSFGNGSTSLSFNQKVNLLLDIDALDKESVKKFVAFMAIRNQFMHNSSANTYVKCFSYLEGSENFLLKQYPQSAELSKEIQLKNSVESLAKEVITKAADLGQTLYAKIEKEVAGETHGVTVEVLTASIKEAAGIMNGYFEETEPGEGIGNRFEDIIWTLASKKFKDLGKKATSPKT